jgi:hypothetical protein
MKPKLLFGALALTLGVGVSADARIITGVMSVTGAEMD